MTGSMKNDVKEITNILSLSVGQDVLQHILE